MSQEAITLEQYNKRYSKLKKYGIKKGLIKPYEYELIERLRNVYYGGCPASILLLMNKMCNGMCYDRSMLITMGMDDFQLVNGAIKGLELRFGLESANHSWAESNGWVYDTSLGYKIEKDLYYQMEEPLINKINSKQSCLDYIEYQEILEADIEKDKYVVPMLMPIWESLIPTSLFPEWLEQEITLFKEQIKYDELCQEVEDDMVAKGFRKRA